MLQCRPNHVIVTEYIFTEYSCHELNKFMKRQVDIKACNLLQVGLLFNVSLNHIYSNNILKNDSEALEQNVQPFSDAFQLLPRTDGVSNFSEFVQEHMVHQDRQNMKK